MPDPLPTGHSHRDSAQPVRCAPPAARLRAALVDGASRAQLWEAIRLATISSAFRSAGVAFPAPTSVDVVGPTLNKPLQAAMSEFIRRTRPSLPAFVELVRCQSPDDYRHNKALVPAVLAQQCRGYEHLDTLLQIASEGVRVRLRRPLPRQARFPRNHPSASERLPVLRANIRKEQDMFRCLVLDADIVEIWPEIFASPFGVVNKGDDDPHTSGRVIHDLSYPEDGSVNAHTDPSDVPKATFEHCSSVAREILRCKMENPDHDVLVMAGDVASAYRNAYTHSACVHMFSGFIPEDNAIIIDLSTAFGWTGSAGTYSVLGGAVAFIHGSTGSGTRPRGFYNYHWVDDHINVALNTGTQCADAERSLRFAMTTVMGPSAVNDRKFTTWSPQQKVLGLIFDTTAGTVAIPAKKVDKAQTLIAHAFHSQALTRSEFRSLLGSLRHLATCVRPAQAFIQRLRTSERILHRCAPVPVTKACSTISHGGGIYSTPRPSTAYLSNISNLSLIPTLP